jgi:hypothetical protein
MAKGDEREGERKNLGKRKEVRQRLKSHLLTQQLIPSSYSQSQKVNISSRIFWISLYLSLSLFLSLLLGYSSFIAKVREKENYLNSAMMEANVDAVVAPTYPSSRLPPRKEHVI